MRSGHKNHLQNQTSPYLLQHAGNPVDWYPWGEEAFERARREDKPIFLSIGYSTCHWCHVMARESFEDAQVAEVLNQHYISVKVDKEERPDIDSIYMEVCQAFTGSGGWPTTVLMTPEQKPFFAGTYFPKNTRFGQIGLLELLGAIAQQWSGNRALLLDSAEEMTAYLRGQSARTDAEEKDNTEDENLIDRAVKSDKRRFDAEGGGFGRAPKFPMPHNLLFLMRYYERNRDEEVLYMVNKTLLQMFRGGLHDHIGGGFCRYSTDRFFLVPHFEKMLYDNALLIHTYSKAYQLTKKEIYREIAERTAGYVLREMRAPEGAFYSAQDADSEGEEGKYYLFEPSEIIEILGEEAGDAFNRQFDITEEGNFEGKSIPNLLNGSHVEEDKCVVHHNPSDSLADGISESVKKVYEYRRDRYRLHTDDKILTAWNALMIAALATLYRVTEKEAYLAAATEAQQFLEERLCEEDTLYVSCRDGQRGGKGFLDEYSFVIYALLSLYGATLDKRYLQRAERFCDKVRTVFRDEKRGGFFLSGEDNEALLLRPKQTADGALPSGNSVMAHNLVCLCFLTGEGRYLEQARQQIAFLCREAAEFPAGYAFGLVALMDEMYPPEHIVVVCKAGAEPDISPCQIPLDTLVRVLATPTEAYPLKNDRTTYYVCRGNVCLPPANTL